MLRLIETEQTVANASDQLFTPNYFCSIKAGQMVSIVVWLQSPFVHRFCYCPRSSLPSLRCRFRFFPQSQLLQNFANFRWLFSYLDHSHTGSHQDLYGSSGHRVLMTVSVIFLRLILKLLASGCPLLLDVFVSFLSSALLRLTRWCLVLLAVFSPFCSCLDKADQMCLVLPVVFVPFLVSFKRN